MGEYLSCTEAPEVYAERLQRMSATSTPDSSLSLAEDGINIYIFIGKAYNPDLLQQVLENAASPDSAQVRSVLCLKTAADAADAAAAGGLSFLLPIFY